MESINCGGRNRIFKVIGRKKKVLSIYDPKFESQIFGVWPSVRFIKRWDGIKDRNPSPTPGPSIRYLKTFQGKG